MPLAMPAKRSGDDTDDTTDTDANDGDDTDAAPNAPLPSVEYDPPDSEA